MNDKHDTKITLELAEKELRRLNRAIDKNHSTRYYGNPVRDELLKLIKQQLKMINNGKDIDQAYFDRQDRINELTILLSELIDELAVERTDLVVRRNVLKIEIRQMKGVKW